jgi:phenylacetate-CoA ligase
VPSGVEGDIVVTSLVNVAMPMVRFQIGDRGVLSGESCSCGVALPRLGLVTGRVAEVLEVAGHRLSPYVFTSALEKVGGLLRYQVLQVAPTRFAVRSVLEDGVSAESVSAQIRQAVRRAVAHPVEVEVELVERLAQGPGGKTRVVQPLATTRQQEEE